MRRKGHRRDVNAAISKAKLLLSVTPEQLPDWASTINDVGNLLSVKYERTGNTVYLDEAISAAKEAVSATPDTQRLQRAVRLGNLAEKQARRYEKTKDAQDLELAISTVKLAFSGLPKSEPSRGVTLYQLGGLLACRYRRTENRKDLEAALTCYIETSKSTQALPLVRVKATRQAIRMLPGTGLLQDENNLHQAISLAQAAVQLLPRVCGRSLNRQDQQHAVFHTSGLAADACSLSLKAGNVLQGLEGLESGRGLILGHLVDGRQDLSDLDMTEVEQAAVDGPVVFVNATDICCDAIIIPQSGTGEKAIHIPLPGMESNAPPPFRQVLENHRLLDEGPKRLHREWDPPSLEDVIKDEFIGLLWWLWSNCVRLVLAKLEDSPTSRCVWWIGTGAASSLPFHAASIQYDSSNSWIHSYTPTLKLLRYSRSRALKGAKLEDISVFVAAMPTSKGQRPLPGVEKEKDAIKKAMEGAVRGDMESNRLYAIDHPSAEQVLDGIRKYHVVHFACHGKSDGTDPANSCVVLQKSSEGKICADYLTASRISKVRSSRLFLAYLSACSTAEVRAKSFVDEGLHLAGAFLGAGFGHVVGSLWSADDDVCAEVGGLFYKHLLGNLRAEDPNRAVAKALHVAVNEVRLRVHPLD